MRSVVQRDGPFQEPPCAATMRRVGESGVEIDEVVVLLLESISMRSTINLTIEILSKVFRMLMQRCDE